MKKILLLAVATLASLSSPAQDFAVDGLTYTINEGTSTVYVYGTESRSDYPTVIDVPQSVEYRGTTYTVNEIGIAAFYGLSRVTSVKLPSTITTLGDHCFDGLGITEFVLPPSVTVLPKSALASCKKLTSVTLHDGLTEIGSAAFRDCKALASLELPASITTIGNSAFLDCEALTDVNYLGTAVTWMQIDFASDTANPLHVAHVWKVKGNVPTAINVMPKVGSVRPYVFAGCTSLISVDIMDGISSIGEYAFTGCTGLESISLPETMTDIAEWAFKECTAMKKVYAGSIESFLNINMGGFFANPMHSGADLYARQDKNYATVVTNLVVPESVAAIKDYALDGNASIASVTLHPGVSSIGACALQNCTALKSVSIPEGVSAIGMQAFNGCRSLDNVTIPSTITSIGIRTFENCGALENISLPETLTRIPDYMFLDSGIKTISLPETVSEIGAGAFSNCTSMTTLNFPAELFRIGDKAFQGTALTEAIITSPKLRFVGQQAFYGCGGLNTVSLPASVTNVGSEAFAFAGSLKSITCKAETAPYAQANMCQPETYAQCTLLVPKGSLDNYRQANGWSSFTNIMEDKSSTSICVQTDDGSYTASRYFRLDGTELSADRLVPGVYIRTTGNAVDKLIIR